MTYPETLAYLYQATPAFHQVGAAAYKPGLDNTLRLMERVGNPHLRLVAVHIAGTNGKGSTSHLIAAALQASGLRVGLYTSPHLVDFRERIRVNGKMVPEQYVVDWVAHYKPLFDQEMNVSFFEMATAMAFSYFVEQGVDIAVVECGLGGRLDSTNVLSQVRLSVITNIGLDHTDLLGHTIAQIAAEKAGIIRPGVPLVVGETDAESAPVFRNKAQDSPVWFADQCDSLRDLRLSVAPDCELTGAYQQKNMQTAFVALHALGVSPSAIREGFAHVCSLTGLMGRWQTLATAPLTICDTGHNSHGIRTYVEQLRHLARGDRHLYMVFGMVSDKDVDTVLSLLPKEAFYYWCNADTHRAIPSDEMRSRGLRHGLIGESYGPVSVALAAAREKASADDIIFIGGSNYVVGEALR